MNFKIPFRITKLDSAGLSQLNQIFDYLNQYFQQFTQVQQVTYTTNMNTDIAGNKGDIVLATNNSKFYGCTDGGTTGNATWVAFN